MKGQYRYQATTIEGFVQQLAVCYLRNRYWFYVLGEIPAGKERGRVDERLLARYDVERSKWSKARSWRSGQPKVQYLRFMSTFVLVATEGSRDSAFFTEERNNVSDARERPIVFYGYSIGYKDGHPHVRIASAQYRELAQAFLNAALTSSAETLAARFRSLPFEPYGPVKAQLGRLLQRVNEVRRSAGLARVAPEVLPTKRRTMSPFARSGEGSTVGQESGHRCNTGAHRTRRSCRE